MFPGSDTVVGQLSASGFLAAYPRPVQTEVHLCRRVIYNFRSPMPTLNASVFVLDVTHRQLQDFVPFYPPAFPASLER